ncbi:hypothetical protein [Fischerella sp. PCC 9605]|uniref:hypothetical protein n=1 Tax=Fischerella sp. PCC 9605 TaxID=1173024 RepID=UPI0004B05122|nr:hypothetical protein [Fischerella sp. PCC 9605]
MMENKKIKLIIALVLALLMLLLWGTAAAQIKDSGRDIVRFGSDVTIAENEVVKDAVAIAGSVTVLNNGHVTGDAAAVGGDVILKTGARVDGDVTAVGGEIFQEPGVTIGGDAVTVLDRSGGVMHGIRRWGLWGTLGRIYLLNAAFYTLFMLAVAIVGVVLMLLRPSFLQSITATISQQPLKSLGWGLGGVVAFLLLSILTGGSLLGAVLIPIAALLLGVVGLLGANSLGLLIGEKTLRHRRSPMLQFLVGIVILAVISLIPLVGGLTFLILNLFGLGGVLASPLVTEKIRSWRQKERPSINEQIYNHQQETTTER